MTENMTMTEALDKIDGLGFDSRERKKSKYLSYPYIDFGPRHKGLPAETEDSRTSSLSHKLEGSSIMTSHLNGSPSFARSGSKRFRRNWYRKFVSCSTMSRRPEFINASPAELLSGLYSTAVDCMFPIENKSFDLVEWFFCRYRLSEYHDETELAASLINVKGGNIEKPGRNDSLDNKSDQKRKNKKMENAERHKMKSLSGPSDMNKCTSTGNFLLKDSMELNSGKPRGKWKQKRKVKEATPLDQLQNIGTTTLNVSSAECSSVPDGPENLTCLASGGKAGPKNVNKIEAATEHQSAQVASGLLYMDGKNTKCSSLVIDLQLVSPPLSGGIPEKCNGENKEELGFIGSYPELSVSPAGLVGNIASRSSLVSTSSEVGIASASKNGQKNKKRKEKAAEEHLRTKLAAWIPDLNGTISESNSIRKDLDNVSGLSPKLKSNNKKRNEREPISEQSRSLSVGQRPAKTNDYNRVEVNGEELGTCLLLQFAPGVLVPPKEDLLATFCQFGPLKEPETQLLKETGSARIVFVKSADAREAFRSIEQNKPFGATLVDYKLHHLCATFPAVEQYVTPAQLSLSIAAPGEAPPLDFMRQNLQMMTSMLEKSGNNLSPVMRAKLEGEIKSLMKKVNSMACSISTQV